ncbi:hypothetical protein [Arthrobacter sp. ZGTC412]|uniref:hypothetical protein n=1 Tax=Arthrobacter sp. ZGTC412 TaxID=2058900 RepID=UPI0015E2F896|nr:hypothetical protein [Arthrobacter sp. ZGTC412]
MTGDAAFFLEGEKLTLNCEEQFRQLLEEATPQFDPQSQDSRSQPQDLRRVYRG